MPDMLCPLVELPAIGPRLDRLREEGITLRRPHPWEQSRVREFILEHFSPTWAEETSIAFTHQPITCFVALENGERILGFAAYEVTRRNYFGPTGVDPAYQGRGIGAALSLAGLIGLRDLGYTYCIIGGAGPVDFYTRLTGAMTIPFGDGRGIYDIREEPGLRGK